MVAGKPLRLFVSYRSVQPDVGHFADRLRLSPGVAHVSTFKLNFVKGQPFPQQIVENIGQSDVVLAVIGPGWRVADLEAEDWVRSELAVARDRRIPVLPVLFDDATMPNRIDLPGVEWLAMLNAVHVRTDQDEYFAADAERVVREAAKLRQDGGRRWLPATIAALTVLVALVAGLLLLRSRDDDSDGTGGSTTVPSASDRLQGGQRLTTGEQLRSADGRHVLEMAPVGVLVATTGDEEFWRSDGQPVAGALAVMQGDGNLVIYPSVERMNAGDALWQAQTNPNPGAYLVIGDDDGDGFVAIYTAGGSELFRRPERSVDTVPETEPTTATTVERLDVPIVIGRTDSEARHLLEGEPYHFDVVTTTEASAVEEGVVLRTDPTAGVNVEPGSTIRLVVSRGTAPETTDIVVGTEG